jgi:hypothetical protein
MKFFKENSYDVVRLFINQIGITIFSFILYTALGMMNLEDQTEFPIKIALSVFCLIFYFSLLYTVAWEWGAKDRIRIDGGKMQCDKLKGVKMAFLANIPNFVLTFICVITFAVYLIFDNSVCYNISIVFNMFVRLLMAMYLGVLQGVFVAVRSNTDIYYFLQAIGYFIIPILAIGATQLGYGFGLKEKKIFGSAKPKKHQ